MHLFLIGAGHVGLVTAAGLARLGHDVTVADIAADRIDGLRRGETPVFEPGLDEALAACTAAGRLAFTTDLRPAAHHGVSIVDRRRRPAPTDRSRPRTWSRWSRPSSPQPAGSTRSWSARRCRSTVRLGSWRCVVTDPIGPRS